MQAPRKLGIEVVYLAGDPRKLLEGRDVTQGRWEGKTVHGDAQVAAVDRLPGGASEGLGRTLLRMG